MSAKAGEATRSGWTAEQTSWRKPGSVSSSVRHPPPGWSGGLVDVDDQAGTGQGRARPTSPLGPGAHDDGVRSPHRCVTAASVVAFRGADHRHGALGEPAQGPLDLRVGAFGPVMEERDLARTRHGPQANGVFGRGVAEGGLGRHLFGAEVGVVDQQVDAARQLEGGLVVLADPVWARPERRRAVVGDVGDGRAAVAHPVADGASALVGDVDRRRR